MACCLPILLSVSYNNFISPKNNRFGFSQPLQTALKEAGFSVNNLDSVNLNPTSLTSNAIGKAGEKALANILASQSFKVSTSVPVSNGARVVDVVGYKWGLLGGKRVYAESRVGYKMLNANVYQSGKIAYQIAQDIRSVKFNQFARVTRKSLGALGFALGAGSTATQALPQYRQGEVGAAAYPLGDFGAGLVGGIFAGVAVGSIQAIY